MKNIFLLLLISSFAFTAMIGSGKKQKAGTLLFTNYYINFQSDIITDASENKVVKNFDWTEETYIFKPVYYTENFLFQITIPYRKVNRGLTTETVSGLYDINAGIGYFIPNPYGDLLLLSNIQFPTGKYDKDKAKVLGGTVSGLQLGLNRYEIQEELHFFKPVLTTALPFLIDVSIFYYHRFQNRDTKVKNGYYMGYETTISAILTKDFYLGPAIYYKKYNKESAITPDVGSSKYQIGVDAFYKLNNNSSITFEYVEDYKVKNRAKGNRFNTRYVFKF